jgi:hypothetical protein
MHDTKKELLDVVREAYDKRLMPRLVGLTDEEYFWEPVPDCWTVHRNADGTFRADWGFIFDEVPPFTTIAWRMTHLIDCYGGTRNARWLGLEAKIGPLDRKGPPGSAADALSMLADAHAIFVANIDEISEDELWTKIGPVGGMYAEYTKLSLLIHQIDEVIHHGAEVALMRDLYRAQNHSEDPFVLAALKGDRETIDSLCAEDPGLLERMRASHPSLMLRAAETGRWAAVPLLAELGFPVDGPDGRGPVHHAAGIGNLETTKLLVELGADLDAKDPVYQATPLGWAEYFNQNEVADFLRSLASARS